LPLGVNYRLAMTEMNMTFGDLALKAGTSTHSTYRVVERTPQTVTAPVLRIGKALAFEEEDIREQIRAEKAAKGHAYSRKDRFYQLISELIRAFESEK